MKQTQLNISQLNLTPSNYYGFQAQNQSEIPQGRRLKMEGLKRVYTGGENDPFSNNEMNITSIDNNSVRQDWEQKKILEITEALNSNAQGGLYLKSRDHFWRNRGSDGRHQETARNRGGIRKVDIEMRPFQDSDDEEEYVISQLQRIEESRRIKRATLFRESQGNRFRVWK